MCQYIVKVNFEKWFVTYSYAVTAIIALQIVTNYCHLMRFKNGKYTKLWEDSQAVEQRCEFLGDSSLFMDLFMD